MTHFWTVYDHPTDFPDCFVARRFIYSRATEEYMSSNDLDLLRRMLSDKGLMRFPRDTADDPNIVEVWL